MVTRTLSAVVFLSGLLLLAGCGSAPKLEKVGVQVESLTSNAAGTAITLRFINPNSIPLVVPDSQHALYLDDTLVGFIKNRKPLGVPPLGSVAETIPVLGEASRSIGRFIAEHPGSASYVLASTLHLDWNDDIYDYKTRDEGRVSLNPTSLAP